MAPQPSLSCVCLYGHLLLAILQAEDRGKAFGVLLFSGSMGGMIGSLYATNLGNLFAYAIIQTLHTSAAMYAPDFA